MWILYGKIFGHVWNHRISRYPPKKIFVNLFGLKRPFSNKISRLRRITDRKNNPIPSLTW